MCVSGLPPGFIVDGSIGCQLPSFIGFSSFQYPSGYCSVGGKEGAGREIVVRRRASPVQFEG